MAWTNTIHSLQGHNTGPTAKHQTPNAIQRIVIHLGERIYETLNPGLMYVAMSRATTIGDLRHITSIPQKCTNSALYSRVASLASFPVGIRRFTHSHSTGYEYVKVKQQTTWVAYVDARQGQTSIMKDLGDREIVQEWTENKKYSRKELLTVVGNNKWRQRKQHTVPKTSKLMLTRKQKDTLLYLIPRTLLLSTDELMAGAQIEEFLSHLLSSNRNMTFVGTDSGPGF
jgi:hypothetical protein